MCVLEVVAINALIESSAKFEQHSVIRFLYARKIKVAEITRQLKTVYGEGALSRVHTWKWCKRFD
ncbi:hypothetical protein PGB90_005462 [Kerria lacca]